MDSAATLPGAGELQVLEMRPLRGPNQWTNAPALECYLDLGGWNDVASDEIPGFNDRLAAWLPGLAEHRCSLGVRGGFLERLRRGTYMAHTLEHVAIDLHCMAGVEIFYGRTRATSKDRVYRLVIKQKDENLAMRAIEEGRDLCMAAALDLPFDVAAAVARLRDVAQRSMLPAGLRAVIDAAGRRNIPHIRVGDTPLVQFGYGAHQRRMFGLQTDRLGAITASLPDSPDVLTEQFTANGIPTEASGESARGKEYRLAVVGGRMVGALDGDGREVTDEVHSSIAERAGELVKALSWDTATLGVRVADIGRPLEQQGGAFGRCEATADPALHLARVEGRPRPVDEAVVDLLFPPGADIRIPIVAITGTNGKTTVARLVAHILQGPGTGVALTCTEGVYLDGKRITRGDCSGPRSARQVLMHPEVKTAVLETARGGILRAGLGFDECAVGVVTNIGRGDHLGVGEIETVEDLIRVKSVVVQAVSPGGTAVLNAGDPAVATMAEKCRGRVVFFAIDRDNPVIAAHCAAGGSAIFVRGGMIVIADGGQEYPVACVESIRLTMRGRVRFQVENVLAAVGAAHAIGIPAGTISARAAGFAANLDSDPTRFNVFTYRGATVVVDFGHNADALSSVIEALDSFPERRRTAVFSSSGDRRDEDILCMGELLGAAFDRVVLYEDNDLYTRTPGEIMRLLEAGMARSGRVRRIDELQGGLNALRHALETTEPGELLMAQAHLADPTVEYLRSLEAPLVPLS